MTLLVGSALLAVATGALVAIWPRRRAWRRAARVRRRLRPTVERLAESDVGKPVSLVGILRSAERAPALDRKRPIVTTTVPHGLERDEDVTPAAASNDARTGLEIVAGDGQIVPIHPAVVIVGSREWGVSRVLFEGDRVLARGTVRSVPADTAAQYRERSATLALTPPDSGLVELVYAGAPSGTGGLRRFARPVASAVVAWLVVFYGTASFGPAVRSAFARATHHCPRDFEEQLAHDDPAATSVRAEECGDWFAAARGAWQAADFERASSAFAAARALHAPPSLSEVAAHLFAGRLAHSALAARALSHDGLSLDFTSRSILECYADALDARAGDPAARGRLLSRVASRQAPDVCAILAADLEAEPARGALIRQAFQPTSGQWSAGSYGLSIGDLSDVDAYAFVLLDGEGKTSRYNGRPPEWYPLHGLRGLRYYVLVRPLGLEAARRENETEPAALQVEDPLTIAAFDSYVGEHADAAREYGRALTLARVADAYAGADSGTFRYQRPAWAAKDPDAFERTINELDHRRFFFLGATLALRARDVDSARTLMAMAHGETHGTRMLSPFLTVLSPELKAAHAAAFNEIEENETWAPSKRLWAFAARGHAADIPARLRNAKEDGRGVVAFVANEDGVLPELRSFVETGYPPPCWACGPHALVDWIAGRREAAQAAGATALDASLGVAARRLQALFLRRDIAVPLYALGRVASF